MNSSKEKGGGPPFSFWSKFGNVFWVYHKSQIFFHLLSAFISGVFLASLFDFSQSLIWAILVIAISVVAVMSEKKFVLLVAVMTTFFIVGAVRFNQFNLSKNSLEKFIGQEVILTGYVDSEPEVEETLQRFVIRVSGGRILVTTSVYPKYKFSDFVEISGELELPQNFSKDFDYTAYLKKDGIELTSFFPEIESTNNIKLSFLENTKLNIYRDIFVFKERFEKAINLSVPEPNASFINGILLGTRQNIPDDLKEAFNKTGTTHILAISGYNIMIISWAVLEGLVWFFRRRKAFWISVVVIILFVVLTGASASVVRAAVMGLLLSFAHGYGRLYDQKNSIILAGAVMIYHNPMILMFDMGFQLSFLAVFGLAYLYPYFDSKLFKIPEFFKVKETILMTLSAQLAVMPLIFYYFGRFSLWSLPTNVLILPFIPAAMLTGFTAGLIGMISPFLGQVIGYVAWAITSYQITVVNFMSL